MFSHCVRSNALKHYINKCVKIDVFPSQIVNDKVELFAVADAAHDATQSNNDDATPAPTVIDVVACLQSLINVQLSNGETLRTIAEGQRELANTLNVVLDKVSEP